ncbi:MAG: DUF1275 domain-containing protein [Erysipelotrichaceae bacterium]|nr:DUF1275 domain-containing protein [Erysipelotrichaceae bacterium]
MNKKFLFLIYALCILAGFLNISTILIFSVNSSHYTGNITKLVLNFYNHKYEMFFYILGSFITFMFGGIICGILFHEKQFKSMKRYGLLLVILGSVYMLILFFKNSILTLFYTTFLLGLQNGMYMFYKHILIRTTHFTGYLSDMGFSIGRIFMGHKEDIDLLKFYLISILSFITGCIIAFNLVSSIKTNVFYISSISYVILGIYYLVFIKNN